MAEITATLVAVERKLWTGEAEHITAQTTEGEIGIRPGHEPMLGKLADNGIVVARTTAGEKLVAVVQGGFLSVSPDKVTILVDSAQWVDEADVAKAKTQEDSDDPETRARAHAIVVASERSNEK